mgnify:FL=1
MTLRKDFIKYIGIKDSDVSLKINTRMWELEIDLDKSFKEYCINDRVIILDFHRQLLMANWEYFEKLVN